MAGVCQALCEQASLGVDPIGIDPIGIERGVDPLADSAHSTLAGYGGRTGHPRCASSSDRPATSEAAHRESMPASPASGGDHALCCAGASGVTLHAKARDGRSRHDFALMAPPQHAALAARAVRRSLISQLHSATLAPHGYRNPPLLL